MSIGKRAQVQLVQLLVAKDGHGRNIEQEGQRYGAWAEVSNPSGFRTYEGGQTQLGATKRFMIRFRFDRYPDCNWKIRYENKDWTLSSIEKMNEKRFYWRITATSKANV